MAKGHTSLTVIIEEVNGSDEWAWERGSYRLGNDAGAYVYI